jgi:hypothetical protein
MGQAGSVPIFVIQLCKLIRGGLATFEAVFYVPEMAAFLGGPSFGTSDAFTVCVLRPARS